MTASPATALLRTLSHATLAAVLLSLAAFGVAEESPAMGLAAAVCAVLGWLLTEPRRAQPPLWTGVPRWLSVILLLLVLGGSIYSVVYGVAPVSAFEVFLAAIIVLKMWEQRQVRDTRQVLALAVFLVIGSTLNATSIWIGLIALAMLPILIAAVMLCQVVAASETTPHTPCPGARRGILTLSAASVLFSLALAAVVFLIVPRGEEFRRFGVPNPSLGPRVTAFTDQVDLTRGGLISESQAKVLDLRVRDDVTGSILGGEGQRFYLRGVTLTDYASGRWQRPPAAQNVRIQMFQSGQTIPVLPERPTGKVLLLEINSRGGPAVDSPFFTMNAPLAVYLGEIDRPIKCTIDSDTGDITRPGRPEPISYRVRAAVTAVPASSPQARDAEVSFPSSRVHDLAARVLRENNLEPDPARRDPESDMPAARRLEAYLRANYDYTLAPPTPPLDADPIEFFLLTSKRGHCEYFASALAAMCRSVGIDARLVAGYLASEYDQADRCYVVRESAAHAWVEARAGSGAWVTLDATPPSGLQAIADSQRSLWARLGRFWERIETGWNRSVTSFDESTQRRLWGARSADAGPLERLGQWLRARRDVLARPNGWGVVAAVGILAAAALAALWKRRRARRAARTAHAPGWALSPPARHLLADLGSTLGTLGEQRPPAQPLATFLDAVAARHPAAAHDLRLIADVLYRDAFVPGTHAGAPSLADARRALRRLRPRRR